MIPSATRPTPRRQGDSGGGMLRSVVSRAVYHGNGIGGARDVASLTFPERYARVLEMKELVHKMPVVL